ncbi:hypothetical protein GF325_10765 [Candidatus Bathyarchaeota archaeon]|nr:hypothetical protein [Candidatus Bathyarchaeota archaeon]
MILLYTRFREKYSRKKNLGGTFTAKRFETIRCYGKDIYIIILPVLPEDMLNERIERLIEKIKQSGFLHDERIARAFQIVPLEEFIPQELLVQEILYQDRPQVFHFKNEVQKRTISAPHMIALMLEYLSLRQKDTLLVLGSKSGYIAAMASLLCSEGQVIIVDSSEEVIELTRRNLTSTGFDGNITLIHGNPLTMAGTESYGRWDKILIPYQVKEFEIYPALNQLNDGGVLFAPIGDFSLQFFTQIIKKDGNYFGNRISTVLFSPLEQNITYLSQQVEFLKVLKKMNVIDRIKDTIDEEISHATHVLQERSVEVEDNKISIIYDTDEARKLHESYIRDSKIEIRDEDSLEVRMIEGVAINMAEENYGKVRVVTIANKLNISFEIIKHFLKKSKKGKLVGDMNNMQELAYVLGDGKGERDPVVVNFVEELRSNLDLMRSHIDKRYFTDALDIVEYSLKKAIFVEDSSGYPMKRYIIHMKTLKSNLELLQRVKDSESKKDLDLMEDKIQGNIDRTMEKLQGIVKAF